ncbi:MAG TPA: hypothetical protein VFA65_06500 [Bryobacteraceae bacterium]|nr:hypothetical protein [Bryobacteraceae bacterium]
MPTVSIEKVEFAGWPNCYRITNGDIELIATSDVGPRIIRCGFVGEDNLLAVFKDQAGKSGEPYWMIRGGHRLWIAPETIPDTYTPDNSPLEVTVGHGTLTLRESREAETGLRKQVAIKMSPNGDITVAHQIENAGPKPRRFAPWALTVMAPGGIAIAPFPPRGSHDEFLLPTNPLVMWAYTDFSDPRWRFTKKYLTLTCDPKMPLPQKAGLFNPQTCCAYLLGSYLFAKRITALADAPYPDFHCSMELFTNHEFLELETLGPLAEVTPDSAIGHIEHWSLRRNVKLNAIDDTEIDRILLPLTANPT